MAKLENFIESYLKNKKLSDYEGWLALYGRDADAEYRTAKSEADTAYAVARAEHGRVASELEARGLSGSGYSDYLNGVAYASRTESLEKALRQKENTDSQNKKNYLSYLNSLDEKAEASDAERLREEKTIFTDLLKKSLLDESAAFTYLTARGVSKERASELAKQSVEILRGTKSYFNQIVSEANKLGLNYSSAYNYAISKGLSAAAAHSVATTVAFD